MCLNDKLDKSKPSTYSRHQWHKKRSYGNSPRDNKISELPKPQLKSFPRSKFQSKQTLTQSQKRKSHQINKRNSKGAISAKNSRIFHISESGNPNSCVIQIGKAKWRSLIDSGAEVSCVDARVLSKLKRPPKVKHVNQHLQGAGGSPLKVQGIVHITFQLGEKDYTHPFYVIKNASRNWIIGCDFLKKYNARIYFDLEKLRLGKEYVNLDQDVHVASVVRLAQDVTIPPQSSAHAIGKLKPRSYYKSGMLCEVDQDEKSCIRDEPGLLLANSLSKLDDKCRCQLSIINSTTKTYTLKRGCVMGKMSIVEDIDVHTLAEVVKSTPHNLPVSPDFTEAQAPDEHREVLTKLLKRNADVFAATDTDFGMTNTVKMTIDTGNHRPIKQKPYRTPLTKMQTVNEAVDKMLKADIIEESSGSWAFPIVIVDKKDGSKRFCVDYRALNAITKPIAYPLPSIDSLLALLGKAVWFTSLDCLSGYHQIAMDPRDKEKTAFTCHRGLYQFKVMPFGLCNAPAVFSELMSKVLRGCEAYCMHYIDDILIFSDTLNQHLQHLQMVLNRIREHGLKLKLKKCSFLQKETSFLGFRVSGRGVQAEECKVKAIRSLSPPTSVREVRSFIGMCSFYRRFIPNFSGLAKPLIDLTKKHARFRWESQHQEAFQFIKDSLTVVPLLVYPDPNKPYVLYTDASDKCIGSCLVQEGDDGEEKPIYFLSHKLSDSQVRWSTIEKEAFAIFYSLQKLHFYLCNARFTIKTDHMPLIYLLKSPSTNRKIQTWALHISAYDCSIEHIKGEKNVIADLLSRMPSEHNTLNKGCDKNDTQNSVNTQGESEVDVPDATYRVEVLNSTQFEPRNYAAYEAKVEVDDLKDLPELDMKEEQEKDPEMKTILEKLANADAKNDPKLMMHEGVLYYLSNPDDDPTLRLYVPSHLKTLLIKQYHDENGHFGVDKTYQSLRRKYYWPNMFKELYDYISKCILCNERNLKKSRPPLKTTEVPPYPWAKVNLDLSGPFPLSLSGNKYIASFIDNLTGYPEAFAIPDKSAETMVSLLLNDVIPRIGCPLVLVTDNGTENVNKVMQETLKELKIHHVKTSVYHPQSNARVERYHRTLNAVLGKFLEGQKSNIWDLFLPQALAAIRFNSHETTGQSPFFLMYGRDVVLPIDRILQPRRKYYGDQTHQILLQAQHEAFARVHNRVKKEKARQKRYADRHAKEVCLKVGDPVYVKNHTRQNQFEPLWRPYYRVIEQTSPLTFRLKNQLTGEVISSHVEHLRLAKADWPDPIVTPGIDRLRRNRLAVSDSSDPDDQSEYGSVVESNHGLAPSEVDFHSFSEREEEVNINNEEQLEAQQNEQNPNSSAPMESDGANPVEDSLESDSDDNLPLAELVRRNKRQRSGSSEEEEIPELELRKRLKRREERLAEINTVVWV